MKIPYSKLVKRIASLANSGVIRNNTDSELDAVKAQIFLHSRGKRPAKR